MCNKALFYEAKTQYEFDYYAPFYIYGDGDQAFYKQDYYLSLLEQSFASNNANVSKMQHLRFPTPPITPPKYYNGVTEQQHLQQPTLAENHEHLEIAAQQRTQSVIVRVGHHHYQQPQQQEQQQAAELTSTTDDKGQHLNCIELRNALSDREYSSNSSAYSDSDCVCQWLDCDRTFENLESLAAHIAQIHAVATVTDGLFHCRWRGCIRSNRGFNARYKMLVHVRTHTKEKPHQCRLCKKCFSRAENLKIHIRSHSGEKPYVCNFKGCNKAYSNSSDRFKHSRTHAIEKPYICKVPGCQKRYTDPSSLRKHVKTFKHNIQIIKNDTEKSNKNVQLPAEAINSYDYSGHSLATLPTPPITDYAPHYIHAGVYRQHIYYTGHHYQTDTFYANHKNLINNDCTPMSCDLPLDLRMKRN